MLFKTYDRDFLMFAEEGDEDVDEQPSGGGGDDEESDIDKLRSSYDTEIAALKKELAALKSSKDTEDIDSISQREYAAAIGYVNGLVRKLDEEKDTAKAVALAKSLISDLGNKYGQSWSAFKANDTKLRNAMAESYAAQLSSEFGGSVASHKAQLLEAKTEDAMRTKFFELSLNLGKEKKPKGKAADESKPRIDRGKGGSAHTNVLTEMEDIDLSTPEGQKKWQEKRNEFKRKLEPASR